MWGERPLPTATPPIVWRVGGSPLNHDKQSKKIEKMEITLKTREELGLSATTTAETGLAKDLFKGLSAKLNIRKDSRPSITFFDEVTNKSQTVTVEAQLEAPVRTGKITKEHLMGFTIIRANNDGLYFLAPRANTESFKVDDVVIKPIDALSIADLLELA